MLSSRGVYRRDLDYAKGGVLFSFLPSPRGVQFGKKKAITILTRERRSPRDGSGSEPSVNRTPTPRLDVRT